MWFRVVKRNWRCYSVQIDKKYFVYAGIAVLLIFGGWYFTAAIIYSSSKRPSADRLAEPVSHADAWPQPIWDAAEVLKRHGLRVQIKYEPLTLKGTPCPGERLPKCEQESTSSEKRPARNRSRKNAAKWLSQESTRANAQRGKNEHTINPIITCLKSARRREPLQRYGDPSS